MNDNPSLAGLLWPLLAALCLLTILAGLRSVLKRTGWAAGRRQRILFTAAAVMFIWVVLLSVLAQKGFFADFSKLPPRPILVILAPLPIVLFIAFSKTGTELLKLMPPQWLVLMQSFRIFVELLLWRGFLAGKVPVQMTFEGRNFDVLTGILALGLGYYISRRPRLKVALAFNIIGLLLLLNILVISALSMPTSIRYFMNEPANTAIAQFPFIFLPGVLVPIAYSLHILSLRQIVLIRKNKRANGS